MPANLYQADPKFISKVMPFFELLQKYFRYEVVGLDHIPRKQALVVMNHGVIPYHGFLLAKKILDRLKVHPRALGADFLFHIPGLKQFFLKGGAVKASPQNAEKLLAKGHLVMLAPGGIYEALIAKKGLKRIPWERRKGFVRTAVKTLSPIVPSYCRGINSAYFNSYLFLKPRIKLLERTRFSLPFFFGIGLVPLPVKLKHRVGKAISVERRPGENQKQQVDRIHRQVLRAMTELAKKKD